MHPSLHSFRLPLTCYWRLWQEQLTAVRGFAAQQVDEVEESTLEKLEDLKQTYEVEVEQLAGDLTVSALIGSRHAVCTSKYRKTHL